MYDEIPSLLYVAGALITVLSWTLFAFSKTIRPEGRRAFILCLSVIWILFLRVRHWHSCHIRFSRRTQDSWIPMSSISMTSRSYGYCRR